MGQTTENGGMMTGITGLSEELRDEHIESRIKQAGLLAEQN